MSGSATHSAMVSSGLKLDAGSWKTKPMSLRTGGTALPDAVHLVPSTVSDPPVTRVSPAIARPIVVLPDPLSPTRPSTSPGRIAKLTPSTATKPGPAEAARVLDPQVRRRDDRLLPRPSAPRAVRVLRPRSCPGRRAARRRAALRVVVLRVENSVLDVRLLDDLALVHHGDPVGEVGDDAHVVGDQHDRGAELVAAAPQQVEDLGLHRHVERRGRLVGDDQPGVEHERHRDDDALLLPAGELVRVVVDARLRVGDADLAEDLDRLAPAPRACV